MTYPRTWDRRRELLRYRRIDESREKVAEVDDDDVSAARCVRGVQ